jgi:FKBP-type peptidyl-prolyl cis-trans isomerase
MLATMKTIIALILVIALGAGGLVLLNRKQTEATAQAAAAAQTATNAERVERFGAEATNPAIAWRETGLGLLHLKEGQGAPIFPGAEVRFTYVVRLNDGTEVDRSKVPLDGRIGQLVPGMSAGLQLMREGGQAIIYVPPRLGYGKARVGGIPENSSLIFEVELLTR